MFAGMQSTPYKQGHQVAEDGKEAGKLLVAPLLSLSATVDCWTSQLGVVAARQLLARQPSGVISIQHHAGAHHHTEQ